MTSPISRDDELTPADQQRILAGWHQAASWVAAQLAEVQRIEYATSPEHHDAAIRNRFDRQEDHPR